MHTSLPKEVQVYMLENAITDIFQDMPHHRACCYALSFINNVKLLSKEFYDITELLFAFTCENLGWDMSITNSMDSTWSSHFKEMCRTISPIAERLQNDNYQSNKCRDHCPSPIIIRQKRHVKVALSN